MKRSQRRVVALVAHADDETLGCGGTLPQLAGAGWQVEVVICSDGLITARRGDPVDTRGRAKEACDLLGLPGPTFLGWPDQMFDRQPASVLAQDVTDAVGRPELLLTHSRADLNLDHRLVAEAALIAVRPPGTPVTVLAMEVPGEASFASRAVAPTFYADISSTLERKVSAFALYATENRPGPHPRSADGIRRLAWLRGSEVGYDAAEGFEVLRAFPGGLPADFGGH